MLKQLHDSVKARANANESLSEPIPVDNDVKQGDIPAEIYPPWQLCFHMHFKIVTLGIHSL